MDFSPDCLKTGFSLFSGNNLIYIPGETPAETELDLPTESHGKIIDIISMIKHFHQQTYCRNG